MKLRDKDNQHKLTKEKDKVLAGLQNHETEDVKEKLKFFESNYI